MDVKAWFYDNTDTLYSNEHVPIWLKFLLGFVFSLLVSAIFYKITESHLSDDHYDDNLTDLKTLISLEKKIAKNKATDDHRQKHKDTHEMLEKKLTEEDDQGKKKRMNNKNHLKFT